MGRHSDSSTFSVSKQCNLKYNLNTQSLTRPLLSLQLVDNGSGLFLPSSAALESFSSRSSVYNSRCRISLVLESSWSWSFDVPILWDSSPVFLSLPSKITWPLTTSCYYYERRRKQQHLVLPTATQEILKTLWDSSRSCPWLQFLVFLFTPCLFCISSSFCHFDQPYSSISPCRHAWSSGNTALTQGIHRSPRFPGPPLSKPHFPITRP